MGKIAPLNSSFFALSIIGFFVASIYVWDVSVTWGFTLSVIFVCMFVASLVSMIRGEHVEGEFLPRPSKRVLVKSVHRASQVRNVRSSKRNSIRRKVGKQKKR